MENRHHRRIRDKAVEEASAGASPGWNWEKLAWIFLAVIGFGGFIWFFISRMLPDPDKENGRMAKKPLVDAAAGELSIQAMEDLAVDFLTAETVDELLAFLEEPEESEPLLRKFLKDSKKKLPFGGQILQVDQIDPKKLGGRPTYQVMIRRALAASSTMGGSSGLQTSALAVRAGDDGEPVINWKWTAGWTDPGWDAVMEQKPVEAVLMKVYLQPDDYYNYEYGNDRKWQSLRVSDPTGENTAFAFVDRSHPKMDLLTRYPYLVPMVIRARFAPGQKRELLEIEELVTLGWIAREE